MSEIGLSTSASGPARLVGGASAASTLAGLIGGGSSSPAACIATVSCSTGGDQFDLSDLAGEAIAAGLTRTPTNPRAININRTPPKKNLIAGITHRSGKIQAAVYATGAETEDENDAGNPDTSSSAAGPTAAMLPVRSTAALSIRPYTVSIKPVAQNRARFAWQASNYGNGWAGNAPGGILSLLA